MYLYIGKMPPNDDTLIYRGMKGSAMWSSLQRTTLRDHVPVFYAKDDDDAVELLAFALAQLRAGKLARKPGTSAAERGVKRQRKDWATEHAMEAALLSVPGLGAPVAAALAARFGTLRALLASDAETISNVETSSRRRVGPALTQKMLAL